MRRLLHRVLRPYEVRELARELELRQEVQRIASQLERLEREHDHPKSHGELGDRMDSDPPQARFHLSVEDDSKSVHDKAPWFDVTVARLEGRLDRVDRELSRTAAFARPPLDAIGLAPDKRVSLVQRLNRPTATRRAICSLAIGPYLDMLSISGLTFAEYAREWGWDLVLSGEDLSQGRPASWAKLPFVLELLAEYDFVLWIDPDAAFLRFDEDI
jgi:hypothetical protein